MNKQRFYIFLLAGALTLGLTGFEIFSPGGAPAGYTGSPGDGGKNCTECHLGTPVNVTGWITSNVPVTGYVPGSTYQITATNNVSNSGKYGFEISPQTLTGTLVGSLTAGSNNHLVGSGKYVTHNNASTTVNSWTFNWTAPNPGVGPVIFYGAFNRGMPGASTGQVALTTYTIQESNVGLGEFLSGSGMVISPNPSHGAFAISGIQAESARLRVMDISGKEVYSSGVTEFPDGKAWISLPEVPKGIYVLEVSSEATRMIRKIMID